MQLVSGFVFLGFLWLQKLKVIFEGRDAVLQFHNGISEALIETTNGECLQPWIMYLEKGIS